MNELLNWLRDNLGSFLGFASFAVVSGLLANLLADTLFKPFLDKILSLRQRGANFHELETAYLQRLINTLESYAISPQAMRLSEIFVPPYILDSRGEKTQYDIDAILNSGDKLILLLGAPGIGKTTLLNYTTISLARSALTPGTNKPKIIPFLIHARDIILPDNTSLHSFLSDILHKRLTARLPEEYLGYKLHSGECAILIDGLDEIADAGSTRSALETVQLWSKQYSTCRFILTSRPAAISAAHLDNIKTYTIEAFDQEQVATFIRRWTASLFADKEPSREQAATAAALELQTAISADHSLYQLARSPLILGLICTIHYFHGAIPSNRGLLYRDMVDVLLSKGAGDIPTIDVYQSFEQIAFDLYKEDTYRASRADILRSLNRIKNNLSRQDIYDQLVNVITSQNAILIEQQEGTYSFIHLTIQEYFAARYIARSESRLEDFQSLIADRKWHEIILLNAEMMIDATPIARLVMESTELDKSTQVFLLARLLLVSRTIQPQVRSLAVQSIISEMTTPHVSIEEQERLNSIAGQIPEIATLLISTTGEVSNE